MLSRRLSHAAALLLGILVLGAPAAAAEVVAVRVGNHPTYTRVVFELDRPAGYRIERRMADGGVAEILVTLEAGSTPRSLSTKSVMVERVAVQDGREQAVAHIRLRKQPSRVKEMILADPPRLVFDLVFPEAQLAAIERREAERKARAAEAKPAAEAKAPAPEPAPKPTAVAPQAKPEPAPQRIADAPAAEPVAEAKPTPRPVAPSPVPPAPVARPEPPKPALPEAEADEAEVEVVEAEELEVEELEPPAPEAELADAGAPGAGEPEEALEGEAIEVEEMAEPERAAAPEPVPLPVPTAPEPEPAAKSVPAPPLSPEPAADGTWTRWGVPVAGALLLALLFVLWLRRRSLPNDLDVTALAEDAEDADSMFAMGGESPQEGASPLAAPTRFESPEPSAAPRAPDITAGPGLFDEDVEKENETMDLESPDLPVDRTASEMPTQMGAGAAAATSAGGGDVARLVRELERRVAQLETRLDESVDARERLERQVAAQAEELRVQRAAIARTQRALRSLNRGEEEQATEPALRDPK